MVIANAFTPRNLAPAAVIDRTTVDKYYYYSALAERRLWVEGPTYLRDQPEVWRRMRLAGLVFYHGMSPAELPLRGTVRRSPPAEPIGAVAPDGSCLCTTVLTRSSGSTTKRGESLMRAGRNVVLVALTGVLAAAGLAGAGLAGDRPAAAGAPPRRRRGSRARSGGRARPRVR